ncbi:MAG: hypothetical protein L0H55_09845 [Candidatus Nitrosocosmicus sp.]|nr:hypothetical protein [Candidatus Nitrosocosmicus sp.]
MFVYLGCMILRNVWIDTSYSLLTDERGVISLLKIYERKKLTSHEYLVMQNNFAFAAD